uniref:interleukin 19 like n=1 Tax=Oncorhynchus gorbuscha TaxID=8017 RepID=UPI001EAF68AE|nr:interleukin 19 like [Oncorhynchus gorbuscha]
MKLLLSPTIPRLLFLLACLSGCGLGHGIHLGTCSVTVHTHELRKHYTEIRSSVIAADSQMGVRLLRGDVMRNIQEGEYCCFLRLLLRFYVERVFVSHGMSQPLHRRSTSALANSFLTINKNLRQCHCHCGEDTRRIMDSLQAQFDKLDIYQAAVKAIGELDSLLDWLEELKHNSHTTHTDR